MNDLALGAVHEDAVAALEIVLELAEGGLLPGGIEDEEALAGGGGDDAAEAWGGVALGHLDGEHHVIADDRGSVRVDDAAAVIDHQESGADAHAGEHGGEEGGFVFAVAVVIAIDIGGEVGLEAADAHLDNEVADLVLDELGDGFDLVVEVGGGAGERLSLGDEIRGGGKAIAGETGVPLADALPGAIGSQNGRPGPA